MEDRRNKTKHCDRMFPVEKVIMKSKKCYYPRLLDVHDSAKYCGIAPTTIRDYVNAGILHPVPMPGSTIRNKKNGRILTTPRDRSMRKVLLDVRDLNAFIDRLKEEG